MIEILIRWMLDNKLATLLLGLLLVACGYGVIQRSRLAIAAGTITRQAESIATLEQAGVKNQLAVKEFDKLLQEQAAAIGKLRAAADAEQAKADQARRRVEDLRTQHARELADLLARPVPPECDDAVLWLGTQINEITGGWE